MHIGNVYAALAAWLGVRSQQALGGTGLLPLRIEDIDAPRVRKDADRWIMDDLHWLGLDWDGEPVYQSQRLGRYEQALDLLQSRTIPGEATPLVYPCFCSRADIRAASAPNEGDGFIVYPGTCRRLSPQERAERLSRGDRHSWRIAMPQHMPQNTTSGDLAANTSQALPHNGSQAVVAEIERTGFVAFPDLIFGPQRFDLARELGDVVIRRSDGLFAYQLAVTVDDLLMGVTQIVRGRDLLRSTAVQLWIRENLIAAGFGPEELGTAGFDTEGSGTEGFGPEELGTSGFGTAVSIPQFAHLPLIDDPTGRRLAKRDKAWDLGAMREEGIAPQRIIGYCAWLLGLRPTAEPCSPDELLPEFSWSRIAADRTDRLSDPTTLTVMRH
ncbi:glutamate--tRNA ligase family protein [Bifidobacterium simiarum]|uniref:glutamate--tRNA ligase family protein n=1 Tax=Bifidobacterium simiarum TaxID=2045441 RepID=UPI001BDBE9DF|nr:tRNA glutamyl-Q(34) synthetase GluQRS [Bifidobacterium simiarum]